MTQEFLKLTPIEEVLAVYSRFRPVERSETVKLLDAVGRVVAEPVIAPEPLPAFPRSLMDGYAVRASDVFSARETAPIFLKVTGAVPMGAEPPGPVGPGETMLVHTGSMIPSGADAVVMVEHVRNTAQDALEVTRAVGVRENVLLAGEDIAQGTQLFPAGRRLCALDVGSFAALGVLQIRVRAKPKVAILSTGDELVDPGQRVAPGQVRDTNASTLCAQVQEEGGWPLVLGRVPDRLEDLRSATLAAKEKADLVLISGGSSVGARDHTASVLAELGPLGLLVHGIAIAPGKPTLLADIGGVAAFGLPGHPVSSFVVFHVVVRPLLRRLGGELRPSWPRIRKARLRGNLVGGSGRETFSPVRLEEERGALRAIPVLGNSAVHSSLLLCDGLVRIPASREGWSQGEEVEVEILR